MGDVRRSLRELRVFKEELGVNISDAGGETERCAIQVLRGCGLKKKWPLLELLEGGLQIDSEGLAVHRAGDQG